MLASLTKKSKLAAVVCAQNADTESLQTCLTLQKDTISVASKDNDACNGCLGYKTTPNLCGEFQMKRGESKEGGPQHTSMWLMRSCTLIEVFRCVRRVVTCGKRNTEIRCAPEKSITRKNGLCSFSANTSIDMCRRDRRVCTCRERV